MGLVSEKTIVTGFGVLVGAGALYMWSRGAAGVAKDATRAAVNVAGGAVVGAVDGVSDVIGLPTTDAEKCEKAKTDGSTWDASFYCPATDFVKYLIL